VVGNRQHEAGNAEAPAGAANPRRYTDTIHVKARVLGLFHVNPLVTDVRCIQQESKE
jgi:hypothetical protein